METLQDQTEEIVLSKPGKFSLEDVSRHADPSSCWIVIEDGVYDVTRFLAEHPGGSEIILERAGLDATSVFQDIGHSIEARNMLIKYYIGELKEEDRIRLNSNTSP
ncbi:cytochrome b5-like isoform X2 [Montipora capricornis]|uniref:cytochrome b5-like isoform X2 n=1 Tax=Montipora capricornis TaxID=246305 RepID=UPI0035F1F500